MTFRSTHLLTGALAGLALLAASCGGGGSVNPGPSGPAAGTADLQGQLVQGSGGRATSSTGDAIAGIPVSLINAVSGALQGTATTGAAGSFEFKAIPSGSSYLLKVEFTAAQDLDGDGSPDHVQIFLPVDVTDQSVTQITQSISLDDSNNDGSDDSVNVGTEIGDDKGRHESEHRQHRFLEGTTVVDDNGNGSFSDDSGFYDSNCDNLPDSSSPSGSATGSGIEIVGSIDSIDSSSFSVGGVTFGFTSATEWQVGDNHHADPSQFPVGTEVKVEGFKSDSGAFVATEVKTGQSSSDDDPGTSTGVETMGTLSNLGVDGFNIGDTRYKFNSSTEWKLNGEHVTVAEFSNGMDIEVEAVQDGDSLIALEVKSGTDSGSGGGGGNGGGDNSGSGGGGNGGSGGGEDNGGGLDG